MNRLVSLLCVPLLGLASCVVDHYKATSSSGNTVEETYASVGGTASLKRSDGSSNVHDHQASFKDAVQGGVTVAGGLAAASVTKAQEAAKVASAKVAARAATSQAKIAGDVAKQAAQSANFGKLIDSGTFAAGQALPIK